MRFDPLRRVLECMVINRGVIPTYMLTKICKNDFLIIIIVIIPI